MENKQCNRILGDVVVESHFANSRDRRAGISSPCCARFLGGDRAKWSKQENLRNWQRVDMSYKRAGSSTDDSRGRSQEQERRDEELIVATIEDRLRKGGNKKVGTE